MPNLEAAHKKRRKKREIIIISTASVITALALGAAVFALMKSADERHYTKAVETSNRLRAQNQYGLAAYTMLDYANAAMSKQNKINALIEAGTAYETGQDFKGALKAYSRAAVLDPENLNVIVGIARSAEGSGDYKTAVSAYTAIVERYKDLDQKLYGADLEMYQRRLEACRAKA